MKNRIVVDANILFSALLKKGNPYIKVLMNANCKFFGPTFVFIELFKHKQGSWGQILWSKSSPKTLPYFLQSLFM